jgi:uracil-DNA glycosylase
MVFVLWGRYARDKKALIDLDRHMVIESAHPSPMSADNGFFGSRPFSKVNEALTKNGLSPINWQLSG